MGKSDGKKVCWPGRRGFWASLSFLAIRYLEKGKRSEGLHYLCNSALLLSIAGIYRDVCIYLF